MADWKKTEQLYEGKAKKVFATENPEVVIVDYKDDATAFNGEKKGTIVGLSLIHIQMCIRDRCLASSSVQIAASTFWLATVWSRVSSVS